MARVGSVQVSIPAVVDETFCGSTRVHPRWGQQWRPAAAEELPPEVERGAVAAAAVVAEAEVAEVAEQDDSDYVSDGFAPRDHPQANRTRADDSDSNKSRVRRDAILAIFAATGRQQIAENHEPYTQYKALG